MSNYEETQMLIAYMSEIDTVEIEAPTRFIYAFKWLAKLLYGEESYTNELFMEMLRNTADKFGNTIPKLAAIRYEMKQLEDRHAEFLRREQEKNR